MKILNKSILLLALTTVSIVEAQSQEDIDNYPDYAEAFSHGPHGGMTWEPIKIQTDDGYTLTMFHITGTKDDGPIEITKPAVILQHAFGSSAIGWLSTLTGQVPMAYNFALMGFDIYLTNNSGVKYSQVHNEYTVDDCKFWLMDWIKWGTYDIPAAVKEI